MSLNNILKEYWVPLASILFFLLGLATILFMIFYEPYENKNIHKHVDSAYGDYMDRKLNRMYKKGLGRPQGRLKYEPNKEHCYTKFNLLPQDNVAFKPVPYGTGCTYLEFKH